MFSQSHFNSAIITGWNFCQKAQALSIKKIDVCCQFFRREMNSGAQIMINSLHSMHLLYNMAPKLSSFSNHVI